MLVSTGVTYIGTTLLNTGSIHTIAIHRTGNEITFEIDGIDQTVFEIAEIKAYTFTRLCRGFTGNSLNGVLADLVVYNGIEQPSDILYLYPLNGGDADYDVEVHEEVGNNLWVYSNDTNLVGGNEGDILVGSDSGSLLTVGKHYLVYIYWDVLVGAVLFNIGDQILEVNGFSPYSETGFIKSVVTPVNDTTMYIEQDLDIPSTMERYLISVNEVEHYGLVNNVPDTSVNEYSYNNDNNKTKLWESHKLNYIEDTQKTPEFVESWVIPLAKVRTHSEYNIHLEVKYVYEVDSELKISVVAFTEGVYQYEVASIMVGATDEGKILNHTLLTNSVPFELRVIVYSDNPDDNCDIHNISVREIIRQTFN